jgi:mannose-6-phosphate isomerase-like protein (cupin superfamily)
MRLKAGIYRGSAAEYYFDERCYITEWWNSPADADVSIARARVEPGVTTRLHRLKNTAERYLILEGKGRVEIDGLASSVVGPGDVVVIPSGVSQRISNAGKSDLVFLAICTPRFTAEVYEAIEVDGIDQARL